MLLSLHQNLFATIPQLEVQQNQISNLVLPMFIDPLISIKYVLNKFASLEGSRSFERSNLGSANGWALKEVLILSS